MQTLACGKTANNESVTPNSIFSQTNSELALHDKETTRIELKGYSYLKGQIDCRNKFLPLEVTINDKNNKIEFLVGFNHMPNQVKNELKFYSNEFEIGTEN